ncbi:growth-regulating factor 1-like [Dorcoceras hygrometricum]|uniref:Growth-regulating factor n=1 Tax=Dorcoceras hygrometricum TaxID=472368 RepID=A0A2Z7BYI7_9LAMI|nr:growth-regulating factor 1-like [Dorcoceras hygrometricum]
MDFGVVSHKQPASNTPGVGSTEPGNEKDNQSLSMKHQRSGISDDNWRLTKMTKPSEVDFSSKNRTGESFAALGRSNPCGLGVEDGQQMLSFSRNGGMSGDDASRSIAFSFFPDEPHSRTGGGLNESMRAPFARMKAPFTPSQWMELEHQALIYKHIVANVPVPSYLLVPIKKSLYAYGTLASNLLGWGPFHLDFSGSNDPEPGRCRRTDGKKWRCSRDAVPDQKYCERHINRGRHRSRKPVEGQTGHAVSGSTASNVAPIVSSSSASVISSSSASNSFGVIPHQFNSLQPNLTIASVGNRDNRTQGLQGLSLIPPSSINMKSKDTPFSISKQYTPLEKSSYSEFGLVTSDSLVNPAEISYMTAGNTDSFLKYANKEPNNQHSAQHFVDNCPKTQSNSGSGPWPEELNSDWTQLSMSIPVAPDFSSSSSSPAQEKSTISTIKMPQELNRVHMSLGLGHNLGDQMQKQTWGSSMCGPLGEVLTSTTSYTEPGANPSSLKAWVYNPKMDSSPTGVLQKSTFVTRSNSSSGSSPRSSDKKVIPAPPVHE